MLRCSICKRPLIRCAVPGLQIGPKCAADRGLLPRTGRRMRIIPPPKLNVDPLQVDWIENTRLDDLLVGHVTRVDLGLVGLNAKAALALASSETRACT